MHFLKAHKKCMRILTKTNKNNTEQHQNQPKHTKTSVLSFE